MSFLLSPSLTLAPVRLSLIDSRPDEGIKQWMWFIRTALELRVKLCTDHEWVIGNLGNLNKTIIGRKTAKA